MAARPNDTTETAWQEVEQALRRMTPGERVRRALDLTALARGFALGQIRRRFPDESAAQHRARLAVRVLGPTTVTAVFGDQHGRTL